MSLADELLDLAESIAGLNGNRPAQAGFRRAVSTAYYALFHFVVGEATANWNQSEVRPLLGRVFEHGRMKQACNSVLGGNVRIPPFAQRATSEDHLRAVASRFVVAQQEREFADYDVSGQWDQKDVDAQIERVRDAMRSWLVIQDLPIAQKFLVLLLGAKEKARQL